MRGADRVGLLATDAALASGIFQSAFEAVGIEWVLPTPPQQGTLMSVVEAVKAGRTGPGTREQMDELLTGMVQTGVRTVVAGCTEISTLLNLGGPSDSVELIDPALELARYTIERATRP